MKSGTYMSILYFLFFKCEPSTALFNRRWSLAKGIAESGIPVKAVFMLPNNGTTCNEVSSNIECEYLGESLKSRFKIIVFIKAVIWIIRHIKPGDCIFSLTVLIPFLRLFIPGKKCNLYTEYSEYPPLMYGNSIKGRIELKNFLSNTRKQKGIFVISKKIKEYLVENHVNEEKVHVINMTVDGNRFANIEKQKTEPYICYCGTVSNFKDGVDTLLESFGMIANEFPNIKLYILGARPFANDNATHETIMNRYGIKDRVYMPGAVPGSEMPQYLKNAEIVVLSRPDNIQAAYGFPTKLGEYLMTGNPVVVTRVGELDDFLEHKKSCLFAEPGNAADFAEKMKWVLQHLNEAKIIGIEGKKVAEENFNYKIEGEKIANIIRKDCSAKCKLKKL